MQAQLQPLLKRLKPIIKFLKVLVKHHFFIAMLVLLSLLIYAVFTVNQTIFRPTDKAYEQQQMRGGLQTSFDKATIDKIRNLKKSNDPYVAPTPSANGRINPFSE